MRAVRQLYDWVLHWAETPYGKPALFFLAFAESSFFPVPPDVLLIALCLSRPALSMQFALISTMGSVLGGAGGYYLGFGLWHLLEEPFFRFVPGITPESFGEVQSLFSTYGFWAVFTAGFTPIPYKVFTIGAGVFQLPFIVFLLASLASRGLRFFAVAGLIFRFGPPIKDFIDRYFNLLTVVFLVLLLGGFFLVRLLH